MSIEMIYSNLDNFDKKIEIDTPKHGKPREIITTILKNLNYEKVLIGLIFVGNRVIDKDNLHLLGGRRHRKYFGVKVNNKIYIKFGWHKTKSFNEKEKNLVKNFWKFNFFETQGMHLIEKSGGCIWFNNLIYNKFPVS